ncbi:PIG-L family deacetylase [Saccharopolyspora flava]|uniref:GlcNAc-PI de-N-acetylase n=1 Tax=Saccharopolyspora flava TaxID=95161 RepID=A0A1I6SAK7_9PSEU|nr:PIG-L family deacetylase [Saccharopolyspora flava]SFS73778.1 GlcNAc-PI de-N-acetylase [Saccharopolyspora flava]
MSRLIAFGIGVALLIAAACQAPQQRGAEPPPPVPRAHFAQVVAHPDDDLLFMNPDLAEGLRRGVPTTGIYLTAGEADVPDKPGYSAGRQEGSRAAYAQMARKPNDWVRGTIPLGHGRLAQVDALRADPEVRLVFLNLPEDANSGQGRHVLTRLRDDPALTVTTTAPAGAAVPQSQVFDRRAVVEALTALFDAFQPTVIRLQDDQPDARYQPNWVGVHDHPDHVAGAALAREAATAHRPRASSPMVLHYRDYNVADTPSPLAEADKVTTREAFAAYAPHDPLAQGGIYRTWSDNSAYRLPQSGRWAARSGDGSVQAFSVRAHGLARWTRSPQGVWRGPDLLPVPEPIRSRASLLARRAGPPVLVAQNRPGSRVLLLGPGDRWRPVDAPAASDPSQTGPPAAVVDSEDRVVLAVKNSTGGVSFRRETDGRWSDLGGTDVQDVALAAGKDGAAHVFATTRQHVLHWEVSREGGATVERVPIGGARPAGAPVADRAADGSVRLLVRTDRGELVERSLTAQGWHETTSSPAPGGIGDPSVVAPGPRGPVDLLRLARDAAGSVRVASGAGGPWAETGGELAAQPTAVVEPGGGITLLGVGVDGRLETNTGTAAPGGFRFAGWRPAVDRDRRAD